MLSIKNFYFYFYFYGLQLLSFKTFVKIAKRKLFSFLPNQQSFVVTIFLAHSTLFSFQLFQHFGQMQRKNVSSRVWSLQRIFWPTIFMKKFQYNLFCEQKSGQLLTQKQKIWQHVTLQTKNAK